MAYRATNCLPHRIPASAYSCSQVFQAECNWMRSNTWQFVGVTSDLKTEGDFLTADVLGVPVIVRRFKDELVALSNVCAHRHAIIRSEKRGNQPELRCQYHGWCYGSDGLTRRIPSAKDFAPIDRDSLRLRKFRCQTVGQLVFVAPSDQAMTLEQYLGSLYNIIQDRCGDDMRLQMQRKFDYQANWKVAIENTLEAYHIQSVHPKTFGTEPGENRCIHEFESNLSSFKTDLPFAAESRTDLYFQRLQRQVMKYLGKNIETRYQHYHLYPNLLISFTDSITLVQTVLPTNAISSRSFVAQFSFLPKAVGLHKRLVATIWASLETYIAKRILMEDFDILPKIQAGLCASTHAGVLGRAEERIASFQDFWSDTMSVEK